VKYAILLTILAMALMLLGGSAGSVAGPPLIWLGCDFLLLGIAHARKTHGLFGKNPDGTLPPWSWVLFLPLHALNAIVWHSIRLLSTEPAWNQVTDQLVIGRRLLARECPGEFANYVDLTAEFAEPRALREMPGYVAFPILDGSTPSLERLHTVIGGLRPGKTFIHCAQGHGRTGLFAVAVLLLSKEAQTVEEGLTLLTGVRPAVRLNSEQANCARALATKMVLQKPVDRPAVRSADE
jgi:hypothetical protein